MSDALEVTTLMLPESGWLLQWRSGWVVELESVVIGLVGFDPVRDSIGRIHLDS